MSRTVSLDHLTVFELTPPQLVTTAAAAGFDHVGIRLQPVAPEERQHPMLGNAPMLRETLARLADCSVSVLDVGVFLLQKDTDVTRFEPVLEAAARLGARDALVCVADRAEDEAADAFGRLCDLGAQYRIAMNLEFVPWTGVKTIDDARRIVAMAARANSRILVDTIHVDRSGADAEDIRAIPRELIGYAQICDAAGPRPADYPTMIHQARHERAFPGEGQLALADMLGALPDELPLSLECPTKDALMVNALDRARRGRAAVDRLLRQIDAPKPARALPV